MDSLVKGHEGQVSDRRESTHSHFFTFFLKSGLNSGFGNISCFLVFVAPRVEFEVCGTCHNISFLFVFVCHKNLASLPDLGARAIFYISVIYTLGLSLFRVGLCIRQP